MLSLELFKRFLIQEIPSIIQILTLPTLIGIFLKSDAVSLVITLITCVFLALYLTEKERLFLVDQIKDPHSELNRKHLSFKKLLNMWIVLSVSISFLAGIFVSILVEIIKSNL